MNKFILGITVGFFCCLLTLPNISCQINSDNKVKSELNVDLIYPYPRVSLDNVTLIVGAQTNNEIYTSPLVTDLSSHQWPQQGINCQHIGRSLYCTSENPGIEKWRYPAAHWSEGSPVIDADGIIYFGSL